MKEMNEGLSEEKIVQKRTWLVGIDEYRFLLGCSLLFIYLHEHRIRFRDKTFGDLQIQCSEGDLLRIDLDSFHSWKSIMRWIQHW